ncbi:MAG: FMN-binding protein [Ilumatobacteraceae bacterium]
MTKRPPASLGRRLLPAIAMTTAASGLVALLDRPSSGAAVNLGGTSDVAIPDSGQAAGLAGAAAPIQPPVVSSTVPAVVGQPEPTVAPLVTTPTPAPTQAQQPVAATTPPAAASGACEGQAVDGPTVDTRWGPVQVEAIVSSTGQICDVGAIQSPSDHRRSVQINQNALPKLHTQVMKAQSTNINGVSGATITSSGYVRSLQGILDSVGG